MQNNIGHLTPEVLLPIFYQENNLGADGGQSSPRVKTDVSQGIHFYIPNFDARRNAVLWHDIHHLLTGYSASTFLGECEISAWEIGSGCKKYWAAFLIDTSGVVLGCLINPRLVIQAYARGRRTLNLYHDMISREKVMLMTIDELREVLYLNRFEKATSPNARDLFRFGLFLVFGGVYSLISIVQVPFIVMYNIWHYMRRKVEK